jgi:hypothetical protein
MAQAIAPKPSVIPKPAHPMLGSLDIVIIAPDAAYIAATTNRMVTTSPKLAWGGSITVSESMFLT